MCCGFVGVVESRSGEYQTPEAVIRDGLALLEARDAFRRAVAVGEAELDRGEYVRAVLGGGAGR